MLAEGGCWAPGVSVLGHGTCWAETCVSGPAGFRGQDRFPGDSSGRGGEAAMPGWEYGTRRGPDGWFRGQR